MSNFEVKVVQVTIEEHPNADAIELANIAGFQSIVKKGQWKTGDWGAYIPEGALLPEWLLKQEGFWKEESGKGMLAGSRGDRVKPVKLRGVLSEGILIKPHLKVMPDFKDQTLFIFGREKEAYLADKEKFKAAISDEYDFECRMDHVEDTVTVEAGDDVAEFFGITKWEPPIPIHMQGARENADGWTIKFDIENFKKFPDVLGMGEQVVITEKLHGTFAQFGYVPDLDRKIVASKGLAAAGTMLKSNDENKDNLYVKTAYQADDGEESIMDKIQRISEQKKEPFYILGEIFGRGIQDLIYGQDKPVFRAFDMYIGQPQRGRYLNYKEMLEICKEYDIPHVPILYTGSFNHEVLDEYTNGKETLSGKENNIREGIVIKPFEERPDVMIGRVILKSVSEKYLTRKNGTELN